MPSSPVTKGWSSPLSPIRLAGRGTRRHAGFQGLLCRDSHGWGNQLLHSADRLLDDLRLPHRRLQGQAALHHLLDVFDLKAFPGKRALEKRPNGQHGMGPYRRWRSRQGRLQDAEHFDEGVARAFAKLDTIKDQVVWWTKGAQPPQLLADKRGRDRVGIQRPAVFRHRRKETADCHRCGTGRPSIWTDGWCRRAARISPR